MHCLLVLCLLSHRLFRWRDLICLALRVRSSPLNTSPRTLLEELNRDLSKHHPDLFLKKFQSGVTSNHSETDDPKAKTNMCTWSIESLLLKSDGTPLWRWGANGLCWDAIELLLWRRVQLSISERHWGDAVTLVAIDRVGDGRRCCRCCRCSNPPKS